MLPAARPSPICTAIDWSGDATEAGQRRKIVAATVRDGRVTNVVAGRTRAEVAQWLASSERVADADGAPTFVGFDFSFSLPEWFARSNGCPSLADVWALVGEPAEEWPRDWAGGGARGGRSGRCDCERRCVRRRRQRARDVGTASRAPRTRSDDRRHHRARGRDLDLAVEGAGVLRDVDGMLAEGGERHDV